MKTKIFILSLDKWVQLPIDTPTLDHCLNYHFIKLFNDDLSFKGVGLYAKSNWDEHYDYCINDVLYMNGKERTHFKRIAEEI